MGPASLLLIGVIAALCAHSDYASHLEHSPAVMHFEQKPLRSLLLGAFVIAWASLRPLFLSTPLVAVLVLFLGAIAPPVEWLAIPLICAFYCSAWTLFAARDLLREGIILISARQADSLDAR